MMEQMKGSARKRIRGIGSSDANRFESDYESLRGYPLVAGA